jgi:L-serine dehydratase
MINFNTMAELIDMAAEKDLPIHEIVIAREMHDTQRSKDEILAGMQTNWQVMQASIERGIKNQEHSVSGLTGGDSKRLFDYRQQGYMGEQVLAAAAYAVGISEVNAVMGPDRGLSDGRFLRNRAGSALCSP